MSNNIPYQHIHPNHRDKIDWTIDERIEDLFKDKWINYPVAAEILDHLHALFKRPKRIRMDSLLITGHSNNGKSTLIHHFVSLHPNVSSDEEDLIRTIKPVILCNAPPRSDEKGLYMSILDKFWGKYNENDAVNKPRKIEFDLCVFSKMRKIS